MSIQETLQKTEHALAEVQRLYVEKEGEAARLKTRVEYLEGTLKGHVIVAGEVKALAESLEKCMEMEASLPAATVKQAKEALALRQKTLKNLGLA